MGAQIFGSSCHFLAKDGPWRSSWVLGFRVAASHCQILGSYVKGLGYRVWGYGPIRWTRFDSNADSIWAVRSCRWNQTWPNFLVFRVQRQ
jgi:hypothetical protein